MDVDFTSAAAVDPERRTISFTNRAAGRGELVEEELMVGVNNVAEAAGEVGAKRVDVEVAVLAVVEIGVDGFAAHVAYPMCSRGNMGVADHVSEWVAVEEGGEFVGVIGGGMHRRRMVWMGITHFSRSVPTKGDKNSAFVASGALLFIRVSFVLAKTMTFRIFI